MENKLQCIYFTGFIAKPFDGIRLIFQVEKQREAPQPQKPQPPVPEKPFGVGSAMHGLDIVEGANAEPPSFLTETTVLYKKYDAARGAEREKAWDNYSNAVLTFTNQYGLRFGPGEQISILDDPQHLWPNIQKKISAQYGANAPKVIAVIQDSAPGLKTVLAYGEKWKASKNPNDWTRYHEAASQLRKDLSLPALTVVTAQTLDNPSNFWPATRGELKMVLGLA